MIQRTAQRASPFAPAGRGQPREMFTVLLASAAPVGELERWFDRAAPGEQAVYASGAVLPSGEPGVVLARTLEGEGAAHLFQERDQVDPRRWRFLIRKVGARPASSAPERPGRAPRAVDRALLAKLLDRLRRCAERGEACPSNAAVARQLGLPEGEKGRQRAAYLFARLAGDGRIEVISRGTMLPRRVRIVAAGRSSGKWTAE